MPVSSHGVVLLIEYSFSRKRLNFVNECAPLSRRFNYIFRENPGPVCPPKRKRNFRESETFSRASTTHPSLPLFLSISRLFQPPVETAARLIVLAFTFLPPFLPPPPIHITAATLSSTFNVRVTRKVVGRGELGV